MLNLYKPNLSLIHLISNYMTKELTLELQIGCSQRFTRSFRGMDCFEKLVLTQFGGCRAPPAGRLSVSKSQSAINPKKEFHLHSFNVQII